MLNIFNMKNNRSTFLQENAVKTQFFIKLFLLAVLGLCLGGVW